MPWKENKPVLEIRLEFVKAHDSGLYSMTELCARYGVSRNIGYKWLKRYREEGIEGLMDRRRRPHRSPRRTPEDQVEAILLLRDQHPRWGARKLLSYLERYQPDVDWPKRSCVHKVLKRHGRVRERKRRRKHAHPGRPIVPMDRPNRVWSADFKGHFKLLNGRNCYPLTVLDGYSRYLLGCRAQTRPNLEQTRSTFRDLFERYGLPEFILTDNGTPFASTALCGLSRLNVWWVKLGIIPKRTQPAHPEQNGRHERMHRTLKAEATKPPGRTHKAQQRTFDAFRQEFNNVRPHQALGQRPPADEYRVSPRPYPTTLQKLEYPPHAEVRLVSSNGGIRWKSAYLFVSQALEGEYVALEEVDDGVWSVFFGPMEIGRLNERNGVIV